MMRASSFIARRADRVSSRPVIRHVPARSPCARDPRPHAARTHGRCEGPPYLLWDEDITLDVSRSRLIDPAPEVRACYSASGCGRPSLTTSSPSPRWAKQIEGDAYIQTSMRTGTRLCGLVALCRERLKILLERIEDRVMVPQLEQRFIVVLERGDRVVVAAGPQQPLVRRAQVK